MQIRVYINTVQQIMAKFAEHLFKDEKKKKLKDTFCFCVNKIIEAYEEKSQKVKRLKKTIKQLRVNERQYQKEIKQLRDQLASLCKRYGEEMITEQMSDLSMRGHSEVIVFIALYRPLLIFFTSNFSPCLGCKCTHYQNRMSLKDVPSKL